MSQPTMDDLPPIVRSVLERAGLIAIPTEEYRLLSGRPENAGPCPFELFPTKFGFDHAKYHGTILGTDDPMSGFHVVECVACGNVTLERPIALASA